MVFVVDSSLFSIISFDFPLCPLGLHVNCNNTPIAFHSRRFAWLVICQLYYDMYMFVVCICNLIVFVLMQIKKASTFHN